MKIINIITAMIFLFSVNLETLSSAPGCFLFNTNINIISMAIGIHPSNSVINTPIIDISLWIFSLKSDLTICPPSKKARH